MELIRRPSVTPEDADCQAVIAERLRALGFTVTALPFGEVRNLWAAAQRGSISTACGKQESGQERGLREPWI